jgi:SP family sugar:H+ symporter-like MFS transporter
MAGFNFRRNRNADHSGATTAVPSTANSLDAPRAPLEPVNGDVHRNVQSPEKGDHSMKAVPITLRTVVMAMLVAMGGFIFGYDTGQISGFLEMDVFLKRFGQPSSDLVTNPSGYYFTNVRSGLIVGLVSCRYTILERCSD